MADFMTFQNLYEEVCRIIKDYKQTKLTMVKHVINQVYLNELIEADDLYPYYWMVQFDDTLQALAPIDITGISKANPGIITTSAAHGLVAGDLITIHDVEGMTEMNDKIYYVATIPTTTTFTVGVNTTGYTTYTSGGVIHHRGKTFTTRVQRLLLAGWHDESPMRELTYEDVENESDCHYTDDTAGPPSKYYFGKAYDKAGTEINQIIWHPGVNAAFQLRYWYVERANLLVGDADVPLLPPQFHPGIVAGAVTRLAESKVEVETPLVWGAIYREQVKALISFNRKFYSQHEMARRKRPYLL